VNADLAPVAIGGRAVNPAIAELATTPAWVCWRLEHRKNRWTKPPYTPAGSPASSTDPSTWSSFDECFTAAFVDGRHRGIGRILVPEEGLIGIDLDDACTADGIVPWASRIVRLISTYWEVSPSSTGLRAWCRGHWPTSGNRRGKIEIYARARFLTVTGDHVSGTPDIIEAVDLAPLVALLKVPPNGIRSEIEVDIPEAMPITLVQSIARTHPQLRRILEHNYPSLSERDLALVRFAKLARWEPKAAWALLRAVRSDGKADRPDYAARTLALVY
jgi:hypothetical protein